MAPITWAMIYAGNSRAGNRPPTHRPTETAGLRWQPEIWPMAKAMVNTVRPNAMATPSTPIPRGEEAASTALPQPPNTSQNVPNNSVTERLNSDMRASLIGDLSRLYHVMHPADLRQAHLQNLG